MGKNLLKKVMNKKTAAAFALATTIGFAGFSFASCKDKKDNATEDLTVKYTQELEEHYGDILLKLNKISTYKVTDIHYVDAETVKNAEKETGAVKVYAKAAINSKGKTADFKFTFTGDAEQAKEIATEADNIFNKYYESENQVTTEVMEMTVDYVADISGYVAANIKNCEIVQESVETVYLKDGEANYTGYGVLNRYFDYLGEDSLLGVFESMNLIEIIADKLSPKAEDTEEKKEVTSEAFAQLLKGYGFTTEIKSEIVEEAKADSEEKETKYYATLTTAVNGLSFVIKVDFTEDIEAIETEAILAEIKAKALEFLKAKKVVVEKIKSVEMVNVTAKTVWTGINSYAEEAKLTNGQEAAPEV